MHRHFSIPIQHYLLAFIIGTAAAVGASYTYSLKAELDSTTLAYASSAETLRYVASELTQKLRAAETQNSDLMVLLQAKQDENSNYSAQVGQLASTVQMLDKLNKTDRELLEKYSSVYFLNENYVPLSLENISTDALFVKSKPQQIHASIKPFLDNLLAAAKASGNDLLVLSAYRSFGTQESLKKNYKVQYGAGTANSFSAYQGYSEHQLGSTVDFTTQKIGSTLSGFEATPAFKWLAENAYREGFIMSYPKGNTHFVYEPWHWRFVGVALATKLHNEGKTFYDLDQREINAYLGQIFDAN
jgi:D-alanyl-D-alanine carboxypeptidase